MRSTPHLCAEPGCDRIVDGPGRCAAHGTSWDRWRTTDEGRRRSAGYGSRWRAVRAAYLARHPTCEQCGRAEADEVHHVDGATPLQPGANAEQNLQAVCRRCHRIVTARRRAGAHPDRTTAAGAPGDYKRPAYECHPAAARPFSGLSPRVPRRSPKFLVSSADDVPSDVGSRGLTPHSATARRTASA